jgi:mono/diheme cytochrome c family protein
MTSRKVLVGSLLLAFGLCAAQQVEIRKVPIKDVDRTSGQKIYVAYCAACH